MLRVRYDRMIAIIALVALMAGAGTATAQTGSLVLTLPEGKDSLMFLLSGNEERAYGIGYNFDLYRYTAGSQALEPVAFQQDVDQGKGGLAGFCDIQGALYILQYGSHELQLVYQESKSAAQSYRLPISRDVKNAHKGSDVRHLEYRDGSLWFLVDARGNDRLTLCRYDLKAKKIKTYDSEAGLYDYCLLGAGQILLSDKLFENNQTSGRLRLLDTSSGKTSTLTDMPAHTEAMAYDAANGTVLFISQSALWRYPLQGKPEKLRSLPVAGNGMQNPAFMMQGRMMSIYPQGLYLAAPEAQDAGSLHIVGEGPSMGYHGSSYDQYMKARPDVQLSFQHSISPGERLSTGELAQRVQLGMLPYDVMVLNTQIYDLPALIKKGYCLNLSDDPQLLAAVQRMYPAIANQVIHEGKLYALPARVDGISSLMYHPESLEALGLTAADIPTSFEGLVDWIGQWPGGEDIRPFDVQDVAGLLKDRLINRYMDHCYSQGLPLRFNDPLFINGLEQIDRQHLRRFQDQIPAALTNGGSALLHPHVLALSLAQGGPKVQPARIDVYIINSQTQNPDLAMDYLRQAAANQRPEYQSALYQDWTEAVENAGYQNWLLEQLQEHDRLQALVLKAAVDSPERRAAQERLDAHRARHDMQMPWQRYAVSPEALHNYQQNIAPYLYFPPVNPFTSYGEPGGESIYSDIQRYLKGQLSTRQLAEALDQKARLMELEQKE